VKRLPILAILFSCAVVLSSAQTEPTAKPSPKTEKAAEVKTEDSGQLTEVETLKLEAINLRFQNAKQAQVIADQSKAASEQAEKSVRESFAAFVAEVEKAHPGYIYDQQKSVLVKKPAAKEKLALDRPSDSK
jgi:hypothetical protein